jgi:predicted transcriptional regulator of viral defense system
MIREVRPSLSSYLTGLLSSGQVVFSRDQALRILLVTPRAFVKAAERLQKRGALVNVRPGFYVIVPPQFLSWGAPPPSWYIDELMKHEGCPYYVGLLKAAELHGGSHQAVMEFQVITDKRLPKLTVGRSRIVFYYRKDMAAISHGIDDRKTDTGSMRVSSIELTSLDLVRYPRAAAGFDNIATVLADLGGKINGRKLALLSQAFERPVAQRLGYLLGRLNRGDRATAMFRALLASGPLGWVEFEPREAYPGQEAIDRDAHWRVIVRRLPEIDE